MIQQTFHYDVITHLNWLSYETHDPPKLSWQCDKLSSVGGEVNPVVRAGPWIKSNSYDKTSEKGEYIFLCVSRLNALIKRWESSFESSWS